jgi:hypothetical protein
MELHNLVRKSSDFIWELFLILLKEIIEITNKFAARVALLQQFYHCLNLTVAILMQEVRSGK